MATFKRCFQFLLLCSLMIASITGATANSDDLPSSPSTRNLRGGRSLQQRETLHLHAQLFVSLPLTLQVNVSPLPSLFVPTTIEEGGEATRKTAATNNRAAQCLAQSFQVMQQDFNDGSSQVKLSTVSVTHREIHQRDRSLELAEQEQSNSMKRTGTNTAAPPTKANSEKVNIVEDMDPEDAASILQFMSNLIHTFLFKLGLIHDEDVPEQPPNNSTANGTTTPTTTSPSLKQPATTHLASSGYSYNLPIVHLNGACFDCPRDDGEPAFQVENHQNHDNDEDQEQPPQDRVSPTPAPVPEKETPSVTTAPTGTGCGPFCPPQEDDDEEDRIQPPSQADPKPEVSTVAPKSSSGDANCGDLCPPDDDDEGPFVLSSSETQTEPELQATDSSGSTINNSGASSCGNLCPHADDDDDGFRGRSLAEAAQTEDGLWEIDSRIESFLLQSRATKSQESLWRIFEAETNVLGWTDHFCDCFVGDAFEVTGDNSVHPLCQIRVIAPVFD